ncbi:MAG TPA: carboxypeptidase-like regulatory domain-containing protein [Bacteroidales bacterium]|nr:carboxypeptidase-like regulatory domain-containing protein [Bacteroidales bacterium]HPI68317.1 carboxypeptidase-like regulatory domain-containing protein [Bacteroidales bacterium]HPR72144.1 carboxypeptidase-like regulatory domain-containing protein [Bacteroidales bacterium]
MIKKISAIVSFVILSQWSVLSGQETILDSLFTFSEGPVKISNALEIITGQSGYNFTYDSRLINTNTITDLTFSNIRLQSILDSILKDDLLTYSVIDKYIIIAKPLPTDRTDNLLPGGRDFVSGTVIDEDSGEPLPSAAVFLKDRGRGTVSNKNGQFNLRITSDYLNDTLSVSYLGFISHNYPVNQITGRELTVSLKREFIPIPEIIIRVRIPQEILIRTMGSVTDNYGSSPAMLTAFYREGVQKKKDLQTYSEAVISIFKSPYNSVFQSDQIKVRKSRKIENINLSDTLAIRLKAGLSTCLDLDGIKNTFEFLSEENMDMYTYRISDIIIFDEESAYVIDFEQKEYIDLPLFRGTMYINTDDYALLSADFEIHPKYIDELKNSFVASPTRGFETWPSSVRYSVSYRKINQRYFLNHVRGDLVFISKKKKRLFNSQFNVFFEMAVTDIRLDNVKRFEREELAPVHSVFSKTITDYDYDFWMDQDFLKPEDNLIQALQNMKVRLKEFSE